MLSFFKSKLFTAVAIVALLFFFLNLIQNLISERQHYQQQAVRSISQSTVQPQTLMGPLLYLQCTERFADSLAKREFNVTVAPLSLRAQMQATAEPRKRGIFTSPILQTQASLKASFDPAHSLAAARTPRRDTSVSCNSTLFVNLNDPRGIRTATVKLGEQTQNFKSGTPHPQYTQGLQFALPAFVDTRIEPLQADITLEFLSHLQIGFVPSAESTTLQLDSNWPHPSFSGQLAPDSRQLRGDQGFGAQWRVTSIATNAPSKLNAGKSICAAQQSAFYDPNEGNAAQEDCVQAIHIGFIEPINLYSLSDRASKYGLLFVVLTFVAVGLFEVMKQLRVHPVQYLLAGAAICTFFLLLVALSEHIGFSLAYASGAAATVLLLTYYASYMLGSLWRGLPFGAGIALLYGLLYVLLHLEQTALAIGAVALFIVLAAVMVLTRRVDWYALLEGGKNHSTKQAAD